MGEIPGRAYVVDDEAALRRSLEVLLRAEGFEVESFASGADFLAAATPELPFGCVLLDLRMPDTDGLAVQRELAGRGLTHPVILITGHGDVPAAVQAMKAGAHDFVEKPFSGNAILATLRAALAQGERAHSAAQQTAQAKARVATLSARELEVLRALLAGRANKRIAGDLGISPRTVEIHRGNLMAKLGVRSLSEAVRLALAAELAPPEGREGTQGGA